MSGDEYLKTQTISSLTIEILSLEQCIEFNPLTISPDLSVLQAIACMHQPQTCELSSNNTEKKLTPQRDRSCLLVVENGLLVGILTERDIVRLTSEEINLSQVKVSEVMTKEMIALKLDRQQTLHSVVSQFQQHKIRHLPVVNEDGQLQGLITLHSIRRSLQPANLLKVRRVKEVMARSVRQASPNTSILQLACLMTQHCLSCVVLVEENLPVGIITERDIVQFQAIGLNLANISAREVMSAPLFCMKPEDSLWQVHQEMQHRHVRRFVVTGKRG